MASAGAIRSGKAVLIDPVLAGKRFCQSYARTCRLPLLHLALEILSVVCNDEKPALPEWMLSLQTRNQERDPFIGVLTLNVVHPTYGMLLFELIAQRCVLAIKDRLYCLAGYFHGSTRLANTGDAR
jgi:hypothetical protein